MHHLPSLWNDIRAWARGRRKAAQDLSQQCSTGFEVSGEGSQLHIECPASFRGGPRSQPTQLLTDRAANRPGTMKGSFGGTAVKGASFLCFQVILHSSRRRYAESLWALDQSLSGFRPAQSLIINPVNDWPEGADATVTDLAQVQELYAFLEAQLELSSGWLQGSHAKASKRDLQRDRVP